MSALYMLEPAQAAGAAAALQSTCVKQPLFFLLRDGEVERTYKGPVPRTRYVCTYYKQYNNNSIIVQSGANNT